MVADEKHLASAHTFNARPMRCPRRRTATFHANAQNSSGSGKHELPFIKIIIYSKSSGTHTHVSMQIRKTLSIKGTSQCHWNTFNTNGSTSQFASLTGHIPMVEWLASLDRFESIFAVNEILTAFRVRIESTDSLWTHWAVVWLRRLILKNWQNIRIYRRN